MTPLVPVVALPAQNRDGYRPPPMRSRMASTQRNGSPRPMQSSRNEEARDRAFGHVLLSELWAPRSTD